MKGKHQEHHLDNSRTEGFVVSLCDRFTEGSNTEFSVHFYLECNKAYRPNAHLLYTVMHYNGNI